MAMYMNCKVLSSLLLLYEPFQQGWGINNFLGGVKRRQAVEFFRGSMGHGILIFDSTYDPSDRPYWVPCPPLERWYREKASKFQVLAKQVGYLRRNQATLPSWLGNI